jgi:hypothetical protein
MADELNQPQPETPQETDSSLRQIRTFEGDMADAIKHQKESLVSIQQAEVARRDATGAPGPQETEGRSKRGLIYTSLAVVLLALGGYGAWYSYSTYTEKTALPTVEVPPNQFIPAETMVNIDASTLSRDAVIVAINSEKGKTRGPNETEQLQFRRGALSDSGLLTTADFFTRLNTRAPSELIRGFGPLFMFGLLGAESHTFILIKLTSFQLAFPGMLDWEPTLGEDMLPLFASEAVYESIPTDSKFSDITIHNRDARILKDPSGNTVLLYAFFDNNILILTDTEETFKTIVNRLQSQKLSR